MKRRHFDLFLVSALLLFLELACIRWFPAHILFLSFFTNAVLLACFLGMSLGCLAASRPDHLLRSTPAILALATAAAALAEHYQTSNFFGRWVPEHGGALQIFLGTPALGRYETPWAIPAEILNTVVFMAVAALMLGPGQELGRCLQQVPDRIQAYSINILGSIAGIALLAAASWFEIPPFWWFLAIGAGLAYFLRRRFEGRAFQVRCGLLLIPVLAAGFTSFSGPGPTPRQHIWSPYYRIDYEAGRRGIWASLGSHQVMVARTESAGKAYALPYLLRRDSGQPQFQDVLVIGAGSGNDVSRALAWGAAHVDAVEIDPAILRLGRLHHPDSPYSDPRVTLHQDDGRNFLRSTGRRYDLIVYGNLDSLVLHSGYSSIRLESYLLTLDAFRDVRQRLKPNGWVMVSNGFPQGWTVGRLYWQLQEAFGSAPLLFALPVPRDFPADSPGGYALLLAGDIGALQAGFRDHGRYLLPQSEPATPQTPNGFLQTAANSEGWLSIAPSAPPVRVLRSATDEWPFFYLKNPSVPRHNFVGGLLMLAVSLAALAWLRVRPWSGATPASPAMFFLGAGFLLLETRAVVQAALLFGSTWMVNTIVFVAILLLILLANLVVSLWKPQRLWPFFAGLFAALLLNLAVHPAVLLGWPRYASAILGSALLLLPVFFAGVVFATLFARSTAPDRDFGANVGGAMVGGLAEYFSLVTGFRLLLLIAGAFYLAAFWTARQKSAPS